VDEHSSKKKWQVQRPWGRNELVLFKEEKECKSVQNTVNTGCELCNEVRARRVGDQHSSDTYCVPEAVKHRGTDVTPGAVKDWERWVEWCARASHPADAAWVPFSLFSSL
jgi:hypothetical protein